MSRIRVVQGSAEVELEADELRHLDGTVRVDYRPRDLLEAATRALAAAGHGVLASELQAWTEEHTP